MFANDGTATNDDFSFPFGSGPGIDLEALALDMQRENESGGTELLRTWKPPVITLLFDMVELQQLEEHLESAITNDHVMTFDEWCKMAPTLDAKSRTTIERDLIVYAPTKWPNLSEIVHLGDIRPGKEEVVSTCSGKTNFLFNNIDVYLLWDDSEKSPRPQGLFIEPKGHVPFQEADMCVWTSLKISDHLESAQGASDEALGARPRTYTDDTFAET